MKRRASSLTRSRTKTRGEGDGSGSGGSAANQDEDDPKDDGSDADFGKDQEEKQATEVDPSGAGMRMLDNVIDLNYYPSNLAKASNLRHRPVGLGIMGETEAKVMCGVAFDLEEGVDFSDHAMEVVGYFAIEASMNLAAQRGS